MDITDKSSIYISIFKRMGGEGLNTKIFNETNERDYRDLFSKLEENERPLVIYFQNVLNWFLLTNNRILMSDEGTHSFLSLADVIEVQPALKEEMKDGVTDKQMFTRIKVKASNNKYFICKFEPGQPYEGIYQVLHFIANNNISRSSLG